MLVSKKKATFNESLKEKVGQPGKNESSNDSIDSWLEKEGLEACKDEFKKVFKDETTVTKLGLMDVEKFQQKVEEMKGISAHDQLSLMRVFGQLPKSPVTPKVARKRWDFSNPEEFMKQIENKLKCKFVSLGSKTYDDSTTALVGGKFWNGKHYHKEIVSVLANRMKHLMNGVQSRMQHPISGLAGCPGSGKTATHFETYRYLMTNADDFKKDLESDEFKKIWAQWKSSELTHVKNSLRNMRGIYVTYESLYHVTNFDKVMIEDKNYEVEGGDGMEPFCINPAYLWRLLYQMIDGTGYWSFETYWKAIESFENSEDLKPDMIWHMLNKHNLYKDHCILISLDELNQLLDMKVRKSVLHTAALLHSNPDKLIHLVASDLASDCICMYGVASDRPVKWISTKLFDQMTLQSIFEKPLEQLSGLARFPEFLGVMADTFGLPRLVSFLEDAIPYYSLNDVDIRDGIIEEIIGNLTRQMFGSGYFARERASENELLAIVFRRSTVEPCRRCEPVCSDDDAHSWSWFESKGLIKIAEDGVYVSRIIFETMMPREPSEKMRIVFNLMKRGYQYNKTLINCDRNLIKEFYFLNEQLLSLYYDNKEVLLSEYYNICEPSEPSLMSEDLYGIKMMVKKLNRCTFADDKLDDLILKMSDKKMNEISHLTRSIRFSNDDCNDNPMIEGIIWREFVDGRVGLIVAPSQRSHSSQSSQRSIFEKTFESSGIIDSNAFRVILVRCNINDRKEKEVEKKNKNVDLEMKFNASNASNASNVKKAQEENFMKVDWLNLGSTDMKCKRYKSFFIPCMRNHLLFELVYSQQNLNKGSKALKEEKTRKKDDNDEIIKFDKTDEMQFSPIAGSAGDDEEEDEDEDVKGMGKIAIVSDTNTNVDNEMNEMIEMNGKASDQSRKRSMSEMDGNGNSCKISDDSDEPAKKRLKMSTPAKKGNREYNNMGICSFERCGAAEWRRRE